MNDLPALRGYRDGDTQLVPEGLGPRSAGNDHLARGKRSTCHNDTRHNVLLEYEPLHAPLLNGEPLLSRDLVQGMIEQAPIDTRGVAVVQSAVDGGERRKQFLGLAAGEFVEIVRAGEPAPLRAAHNQPPGTLEQRELVLRDRHNELAASG